MGEFKPALIVTLVSAMLAGCAHDRDKPASSKQPVLSFGSYSVASKALGPNAYFINPDFGQRLKAKSIYRFDKNGYAHEICEIDGIEQTALKSMPVSSESFSGEIKDDLQSLPKLSIPGIGVVSSPYNRATVEGYSISTAISPTSGDAADYILANLGPNCPAILAKNKPYLVVTRVANADRAQSIRKGFFEGGYGFGPASISWSNPEMLGDVRKDVTFAVSGKYVK